MQSDVEDDGEERGAEVGVRESAHPPTAQRLFRHYQGVHLFQDLQKFRKLFSVSEKTGGESDCFSSIAGLEVWPKLPFEDTPELCTFHMPSVELNY